MITIEETDDRFYISESTLPEAGRGLFAKVPIKKGSHLEIIGVQVKAGGIANACTEYGNKYKFAANAKKKEIVIPMGYGGIVNHSPDKASQNAAITYIENRKPKNPAAGNVVYAFLRDIEADEEILGNYGDDWSKVLTWAEEMNEKKRELPEEQWETFLTFDLYNLGDLSDIKDEE